MPRRTAEPPNHARDSEIQELAGTVGSNLKRLRRRRGLAKLSGVSRAMISQIELGRSVPTIALLWKLARALEVPFAALTSESGAGGTFVLRSSKAKTLTSADGSFTSRALFPFDAERRVEFYQLTLAGHSVEMAQPHAAGTVENLVVTAGEIEIDVAGTLHRLRPDDAIMFQADVPHSYRNVGAATAVMYLVMTYVESVG